jgi:hypothetical protein
MAPVDSLAVKTLIPLLSDDRQRKKERKRKKTHMKPRSGSWEIVLGEHPGSGS